MSQAAHKIEQPVSFTPPQGFTAVKGCDHHVTFPVIGRKRSGTKTLHAFGSMGFVLDGQTQSMFRNPDYDAKHLLAEKELYAVVLVSTAALAHHGSYDEGVGAICEKFSYRHLPADAILDCCLKITGSVLCNLQAEFFIVGHTPLETAYGQPCVLGMARASFGNRRIDDPKGVARFSTSVEINPYGVIALRRG